VLDDPESEKLYLVLEYVEGGCVLSERDRMTRVKFPLEKARAYGSKKKKKKSCAKPNQCGYFQNSS
jgi:hypothetical protein